MEKIIKAIANPFNYMYVLIPTFLMGLTNSLLTNASSFDDLTGLGKVSVVIFMVFLGLLIASQLIKTVVSIFKK